MPFDGQTFVKQDDVLDLLRRARERIARPDGWCKYRIQDDEGRVCAFGVIVEECLGVINDADIAAMILRRQLPAGWTDVAAYNDAMGSTQADIVALFDSAIARREAELSVGER